jgi:hypothetical protein
MKWRMDNMGHKTENEEWVSEGLLFIVNSAMFRLYHGENKLIFNAMMNMSTLYYTNTLVLILIVIAHWNNSARIDVLPHSDTLSLFPTNQSLLFLFNAVYLAEKQQISILLSLVWPDRGSNPRSTALEPSKLIITPLMRFTERRQTKLKTRERGKLTRT